VGDATVRERRSSDIDASTFLFADLAGYTALTEAHGDEHAADLVDEFVATVRRLLERCDGEEIKLIGDQLMARIDEPGAAVEFAVALSDDSMRAHERLAVRVGLHHGPAVRRGDDWFGSTVNVAARVAALARPGEVLLTAETATAAGELDAVTFINRREARLKNLPRPVEVVTAASESDVGALVRDPVCQMLIDPKLATAELELGGVSHWFCSAECRAAFEADPAAYA
jgi:adenylate cyclase